MDILSTLSIAVGLAMDAFAVSLSNGMSVNRLRVPYALKLAVSFGVFQAVMPALGWLLGISFREKITAIDHWIAFILLSFIGIKMIKEGIQCRKNPDSDKTCGEVSFKMVMVLALATSIDALAVGVTFAFIGVNNFSALLPHISIIGAVTFVICIAGVYMGKGFGRVLKDKAEIFGGAVLVLIGLKILIEHLLG